MPTTTTAADIGVTIAAARKAAGLTQKSLAALAGTSQAVVSGIEGGKNTSQIGLVLRLIAALGLVVDVRAPGEPTIAGATAAVPPPASKRPDNVVFDEPLPDDSIDIDAIVGGKSRLAR